MNVRIAFENPLQDHVRALVAALNAHLQSASPRITT